MMNTGAEPQLSVRFYRRFTIKVVVDVVYLVGKYNQEDGKNQIQN